MTGPEHYREAERSASQAERLFGEWVDACDEDGVANAVVLDGQVRHCREMAALHATLAQAAATALMGDVSSRTTAAFDPDLAAWEQAAGVKPSGGTA